MKKLTFEYIKNHIESFSGWKCLSAEYIEAKTKLHLECPDGHICWVSWDNFKRGRRCRKCQYIKISIITSGSNHWNWNPNREVVRLNEYMSRKCGDLLHYTLESTNQSKTTNTYKLLGYTNKDLGEYLLKDPLWELYLQHPGKYHIDHIYPIVAFVEHGIYDPSVINALDNLQILSEFDNCSKVGRYDKPTFRKKYKHLLTSVGL